MFVDFSDLPGKLIAKLYFVQEVSMDGKRIEERLETRSLAVGSTTALGPSFETDEAPEVLVTDLSLLPAFDDGQDSDPTTRKRKMKASDS